MQWLILSVLAALLTNPERPQSAGRPDHPAQQTGGWQYEQVSGPAGQPIRKASLASTNAIELAYPYEGAIPVTLTIRQGRDEPQVSLAVAKGFLTRSFQGGRAQVRFDGGPAVTYALSAAANGRANLVFVDEAARFIGRVKAARQLTVRLEFAGQPVRNLRFSTAGLRWP